MAHYASSLFRPLSPHQPVTVLLLIENSQRMYSIWQDLRESYLVRLVDSIVSANPSVVTSVSVIESVAIDNGLNSSAPRQYSGPVDGLFNINFNHHVPENRISASRVNECIDYLDTNTYSIGQPSSSLHLVVVATSTPSNDCTGMTIPSGSNLSPWILLAEKLVKRDIHCHLVMSAQEDMTPLTMMFEETLLRQQHVEETPPFPVDHTRTTFRLSARRTYNPYNEPESSSSSYAPHQRLTAPPRRNSYPLDNFYSEPLEESGSAVPNDGEAPSLVSHLQQVHGLTKKKVYGAKPVRQPFIRDERVRDHNSGAASSLSASSSTTSSTSPTPLNSRYRKPTPLTTGGMPLTETIPSPTHGGRAMSQSRADRIQRVSQATGGSSPTDAHPHSRRAPGAHGGIGGSSGGIVHGGMQGHAGMAGLGWHTQRRGSRLSTPEPEGISMGSPASSSGGSISGSGTLGPTSMSSNSGPVGPGPNLGLSLGPMSSSPSVGSAYHDMSPGSGSSYVSSDISSPVTPGSMEDLFGHATGRMHQSHPLMHNGMVYSNGAMGAQEAAWATQQHQIQQQQRQFQQMQEVHAMQQQQQAQAHQLQQMQEAHAMQQQQAQVRQMHAQYLNHGGFEPSTQTYFPPMQVQDFYNDGTVSSDGTRGVAAIEMQGQQPTGMPESMQAQMEMQAQVQHEQIQAQQAQLQHLLQTKQQLQFVSSNVPMSSPPLPIVPSQATRAGAPVGSQEMHRSNPSPPHGTTSTRTSPSVPAYVPAHVRSRTNSVLLSAATPTSTNNTTPSAKPSKPSKHKKTSSASLPHPSNFSAAQPPTNDDEERFTFNNDFVAATVALFEEEVLPAYPNFPGMSSGLLTGPGALIGESANTGGSSGAGELYATRTRTRGSVGGEGSAPMGNAVMATSQNMSGGPAYLAGVAVGGTPILTTGVGINGSSMSMATTTSILSSSTYAPPPPTMMPNRAAYSYGAPHSYPQPHGSSLTGWAG